jgi:hypothetical protein
MCGLTVYQTQGAYLAGRLDAEKTAEQIEKSVKAIMNLEKRPVLPFKDPAKPEGVDDVEIFARLPTISLDDAANL